jgi:hypothetical protein
LFPPFLVCGTARRLIRGTFPIAGAPHQDMQIA